jgi:hypothetical protein
MKSGKAVFLLIGLIMVAALFLSRSQRDTLPPIQGRKFLLLSFEDFNTLVGGNDRMDAAQRKHIFEKYKGRYVRWSGEVGEVVKEISRDYVLRVKHSQITEDFEVSVRFDKSKERKLLMLKRGDVVNYMGKLTDFNSSSGYYLEDGDIE